MKKSGRHTSSKLIILDLFFYAAAPFLLWKFGREAFGDYAAMLISTIPGFIYTFYRFFLERQFNIAGLFIIGSLVLGTIVDLLSGSAEQMLWNGVYVSFFYIGLHLFTLIIRRPLALYFAVDFVYLLGDPREQSKKLFFHKGIFKWFQLIQLIFVVRGMVMVSITIFLLNRYGVDGYESMLIYKRIVGWVFSIMTLSLYFYIKTPVRKLFQEQQEQVAQSG